MKSIVALICLLTLLCPQAEARVDLHQGINTLQNGSYLELDHPILIHQGTTAVMMGRRRVGRQSLNKVGGPTCEIDLVKAQGIDIFKQNLVLRTGTRLYVKQDQNKLSLTDEGGTFRLPLTCRVAVATRKGSKKSTTAQFTILDFAKSFGRVGTLCMVDSRRTAKN